MKSDLYAGRKVVIIGAGFVGASISYSLVLRDCADKIILIDSNENKAKGEVLDIRHGLPYLGTTDLRIGDFSDCKDCDLIIIAVGRGRKENESRLDLAGENLSTVKKVVDEIKKYYTKGVILIITNPVDIITQKVTEWMDLPDGLVFGTGCVLDTSRFIRNIADYVSLGAGSINGLVVGEHGDGQVPIWSKVTVGSLLIPEYCENMGIQWNDEVKNKIYEAVKKEGSEIVRFKGRTHFGIATCVCRLATAVLNRETTILPVTSSLLGEHGVTGVSLSVPSIVGENGVQKRLREHWSSDEYRAFFDTVINIREFLKKF